MKMRNVISQLADIKKYIFFIFFISYLPFILFQAIKMNECICLFCSLIYLFTYYLFIYIYMCVYLCIIIYLVGWF